MVSLVGKETFSIAEPLLAELCRACKVFSWKGITATTGKGQEQNLTQVACAFNQDTVL